MPEHPLQMVFLRSAERVSDLPDTPAEVALVGRSNVGKSSLINALANHRQLAHVSKAPGRTRTLNLFRVEDTGTLMDLPGYGFAAAPAHMRQRWQAMIERYLLERKNLVMVAVLVDGVIGPTPLDLQMLGWLRAHSLPHTVIATKHDKVKPSQRGTRRRDLAAGCDLHPTDPTWVSAATGANIDHLRDLIRLWVGAVDS
jgi:GTP-binding protein